MIFDTGSEPEPIQTRLFMNFPGETSEAAVAVDKFNDYIRQGIELTYVLDMIADEVPMEAYGKFLGWIVAEEARAA